MESLSAYLHRRALNHSYDRIRIFEPVPMEVSTQWLCGPWLGRLRADRGVVTAAVSQDGRALQHVDARLCADEGVVTAACASHGMALALAHPDLRGNRAVVLAAVQQDGRALRYASEQLRNDREVCRVSADSMGIPMESVRF